MFCTKKFKVKNKFYWLVYDRKSTGYGFGPIIPIYVGFNREAVVIFIKNHLEKNPIKLTNF